MNYTHINPSTKKRECLKIDPDCTFQEYIEHVLKEAGFRIEERDPLYNRVHLKGCLDIFIFWKAGSMQLFESRESLLFLLDITWDGWHFHRLGDHILETLRAQWKHHNAKI